MEEGELEKPKAKWMEKVRKEPNQDYQKTTPNKGIQNKNCSMLRCKSVKYHSEQYTIKQKNA